MVKMICLLIVQLLIAFLQERAEFVFCPLALQLTNSSLERMNTASNKSLIIKSEQENMYNSLDDVLFQFVK